MRAVFRDQYMLTLIGTTVTTTQIIVAGSAAVGSAIGVGTIVVVLTKTMTEFKIGIASLAKAVDRLTQTMETGFTAVHDRLDRGESKIGKLEKRVIRTELHLGIDSQEH